MPFWIIVAILGLLMLLDSEVSGLVLILLVIAGALLLIHWIMGFAIFLTLAKLCAVGIILLVAYSIIVHISGK